MKEKQIGLPSLILMGFSLIAGITFTASFGAVVMGQNGEKGVGIHVLWIFALEGLITFFCVWPFAKLARIHPKSNGGVIQYARASFGKFWGVFAAVISVGGMAIGGVILMVSMIRQNFGPGAPSGFQLVGARGSWGSWGNLYLDLIGFCLFLIAGIIIYFGVRKLKIASNLLAGFTWTVTFILMVVMVVGWTKNGNLGLKNYTNSANINLSFKSFSSTFATNFFAFAGVETFVSAGANIKNPKKNTSIAITWIMIMATAFYIVFSLLIMGAVTNGFGDNPNLQIFAAFGGKTAFVKWAGFALILCTLLIRFNNSIQVPLYTASMIEPLAKQMYISPKYGVINKNNLPTLAIVASTVLIGLTAFIFLFIPDIIEGVTNAPSPFDYATIASAESIILLLTDGLTIVIALYQGFKKNLTLRVWEKTGFVICLIFLTWQIVMWIINLIEEPLNQTGNAKIQAIVATVFQIVYMVMIVLLSVYLMFHHKKLVKKYPKGTPEYQEMVAYEKMFVLQDENSLDEDLDHNSPKRKNYQKTKPKVKKRNKKVV